MSVIETKNPSSLRIRYDMGLDEISGKTKVRSKSYSNIANDATGDKVYEVASAISSLQNHNVLEVIKLDNTTISQ